MNLLISGIATKPVKKEVTAPAPMSPSSVVSAVRSFTRSARCWRFVNVAWPIIYLIFPRKTRWGHFSKCQLRFLSEDGALLLDFEGHRSASDGVALRPETLIMPLQLLNLLSILRRYGKLETQTQFLNHRLSLKSIRCYLFIKFIYL